MPFVGRLGDVIALMHSARERYSALELAIRVRVDDDLLITSRGERAGSEPLGIREQNVHVWVASPRRWRVSLPDGEQGRDGDRWWTTNRNGFTTGVAGRTAVEVPEAETQPFEELWDPALLIAELWLEPGEETLEETFALGRRGIVVGASPRPTPRPSGLDFILLEWPGGDQHELVVDLELGIVLRLRSFWHGRELLREQVVELKVDPVIPDGFFLDEGAR
jgi:hypothetical protein